MPSFDVVSELNLQEVDNAVNQAKKEIITRYDFKDTGSDILLDKEGIHLSSSDNFKMRALIDIFQSKAVKRGLSLKALEVGTIEQAAGGRTRCLIKLVQGISEDKTRDLVKKIKALQTKVQASIDGSKIRVSGKKKDDLQEVIQALRALDYTIPLQFINFRD